MLLALLKAIEEAVDEDADEGVDQGGDGYLGPAPLHRLTQQAASYSEENALVRDEEDVGDEEAVP